MTAIDEMTVVASSILILLAIVTPFINVMFRKPRMSPETETTDIVQDDAEPSEEGKDERRKSTPPGISVILTPHENARELEENLPSYLSQAYEGNFEIIVVAWKGDLETEDILKRFAGDPHFYSTYIPTSSRYMSRKKLAITIGVKAARHEWVMLADIECRPMSDRWLQTMSRNCDNQTDIVVGHTCYDDDTSAYRRFETLQTEMYLMREYTHSTAYRCESKNMMFRKDMFIEQDGYRGNLKYLRGEYDFIVNKYARKGNVALEIHTDAWNMEQSPTEKAWRNKHLFYMENRKHMLRSTRHRLPYNTDQFAMHLNYLAIIAAIALSILTERWFISGAAVVALVITLSMRATMARKALRMFAENISAPGILLYETCVIWHRIGYMVKYMRADKDDFISHKV